jgi:hypothetical protein
LLMSRIRKSLPSLMTFKMITPLSGC